MKKKIATEAKQQKEWEQKERDRAAAAHKTWLKKMIMSEKFIIVYEILCVCAPNI